MSNVYQDTEDAVVPKLQADAWFANPANIKAIRTDVPETDLPVADFTELFADADLPAVAVLTLIDDSPTNQRTIGETESDVPIYILGLVMERTKAAARNKGQEMAGQIVRFLNQCASGKIALAIAGRGHLVRQIRARLEIRREEPVRRYYGLVTVSAVVTVIRLND